MAVAAVYELRPKVNDFVGRIDNAEDLARVAYSIAATARDKVNSLAKEVEKFGQRLLRLSD